MKMTKHLPALLAVGWLAATPAPAQVPGLLNYQGRLLQGTNLVNGNVGLSLRLYAVPAGGGPLYEDSNTVAVTDSLYATWLGDQTNSGHFANALQQPEVWVEVAVNGTALTPRERLVSAAYALLAGGVRTGGVSTAMLADGAVTGPKLASSSISNVHLAAGAITTTNVADGTITPADLDTARFSNTFWKVDGNAGLTPGTHYLGTPDQQPLDLRVNNQRGLRLQHTEVDGLASVNLTGGHAGNTISTAVVGGVIGGGGLAGYPNRVTDSGGTVGGGIANVAGDDDGDNSDSATSATVAGGENNRAAESYAAVGGGRTNTAAASYATVAGGRGNRALGLAAAIAGGRDNTATGDYSVVAGGEGNLATGAHAAVPGGEDNSALGSHSLAVGRRAKAGHAGTFVWADDAAADFGSSSSNQFLIRASGGTGIGTTNPLARLHVQGNVIAGTGITPGPATAGNTINLLVGASSNAAVNGIGFWENTAGSLSMSLGYDGSLSGDENALHVYDHSRGTVLRIEDGGNVGIGVDDASARLRVRGGTTDEPVLLVEGLDEATTNAVGTAVILQAGRGGPAGTISSLAGSGGDVELTGGAAGSGGLGGSGGDVALRGGAGSLIGAGGDIRLAGGTGIVAGDVLLAVAEDNTLRGRVGIGAGLPYAHLHVVGETNLGTVMISPRKATDGEDARLLLTEDDNGTYGMGLYYDGGSNMLQVVGIASGATNGPHLIIARDTGRVGIGTLNLGTHQLSVGGSIHAEEVVVETGWADFVFEPDYPLPSLDDVRRSIRERGHLPGVPSAAEVEQQGLSLGAMQTLLMQKIEELTLYTLQQQRELDHLRAEIAELRKDRAHE